MCLCGFKIMNRICKKITGIALLTGCLAFSAFAQEDFTRYIDPTIGNVAQFLVPTYPTMHLPNQMIRMFLVKQDYITDQVDAFPLQVVTHRAAGIMQMKVALGDITAESWKQKMNIDHDLEVVHPWFYSTYLIDNDIRVSFVPGIKSAVYKFDFPGGKKKNILIRGNGEITGTVNPDKSFHLKEKIDYKTRGIFSETRTMYAYVYAVITDEKNQTVSGAEMKLEEQKFAVVLPEASTSTVFLKYAVSYISFEQAKINFEKELSSISFEALIASGKKAWEKVTNQIEVEGGTEAQKRTFYTSLYRTYERMVDVNEYGRYFSGYDGKVHESTRPFFVDDWIWDTYRATHPLRTILNPQLKKDMPNS